MAFVFIATFAVQSAEVIVANEPKEAGELSQRDREILDLMRSEGVESWMRIRSRFKSAVFKGVDIRNWFTETEAAPERITNWVLRTQGDSLALELTCPP